MILSTYTTIALRCPICGKMDFYALSRFSMTGNSKAEITCECGTNLLTVGRNNGKSYWLKVECSMCEDNHKYTFNVKELWSNSVSTLICEETGVEIGFIGPRDEVRRNVQNMDKSVQEMAQELGYGEYFNNPEIMYKVLEHLHVVADKGNLYCGCGNYNLEVEIYPDRMELHCNDCGSVGIVFAESFKDWEIIRRIGEIVLAEGTYKYIDDKKPKKRKTRLKK